MDVLFYGVDVGFDRMTDMWLLGRIDEGFCLREEVKYTATIGDEKVIVTLYDHAFPDGWPVRLTSLARRCSGLMLLYSVTSERSFEVIQSYYEVFAPIRESRPVMVCGNNCDRDGRVVSRDRGEAFAKEIGALFMEVSADGNVNLGECFRHLLVWRMSGILLIHAIKRKGKRKRRRTGRSAASAEETSTRLVKDLNCLIVMRVNGFALDANGQPVLSSDRG